MVRHRTNLVMVLVMLVVGMANLRWAEKLPVGDGFGWDGVNYAAWARDFYKSVLVDRVADYYVQRLAPSAAVHYGTRAVLSPFYSRDESLRILNENKNLLLSFGIYNLVLLVAAVYLWGLIADHLQISDRGKWFGFCFLFINYAILKGNFYTPVSTDPSGFVLGLLMFYFFLTRKAWGLLAVMVIGGFTWPTIPPMTGLLLALPRPAEEPPADQSLSPFTVRRFALLVSLLVCAFVAIAFAYLARQGVLQGWDRTGMVGIDFALLYSSMAAVLIYLFFGFRAALSDSRLFNFRYIFSALRWKWAAVAILTLLLLRLSVHLLAGPVPSTWTFRDFVTSIFVSSLAEPFIFVVAHAVYYGPAILLLLIFWKRFCEETGRYGIGFRLFVILNVMLSICPQSRYQIPVVGAFTIILVKILDPSWLKEWNLSLWLLLSLFYSKVWYTFNTSPMNPDGTMATFHTFPLQNLFMNSGPWMSHDMYLVQGGIVLLTALALHWDVASRRGHLNDSSPTGGPVEMSKCGL
jgi:hypothetical protein